MEEDNNTSLTDYYFNPYQGKRYQENITELMIVPAAIKVMAWIVLLCGVIGNFSDIEHGSWMLDWALSLHLFSCLAFIQ